MRPAILAIGDWSNLPVGAVPEHVEALQHSVKGTFVRQLYVFVVKRQRGARVLDGIVRVGLDAHAQHVRGQELERQEALPGQVVQFHRVIDLSREWMMGNRVLPALDWQSHE